MVMSSLANIGYNNSSNSLVLEDDRIKNKSLYTSNTYQIPELGLSDVGILAAHPLVDDYEFFNGTSYAIGTTSDTLIVDGVYIYPPTTSLGGFSVLEHCVISADSTGTKFKRILSASTTDLECSKIEIFEFGIRIIGTVSCVGFGSCQSNGVSFSMEWNNTIYSSNSCSGCFFIIDMTLDGNVSRISTVSVQGLSTSTNCRMPTIKDAVVSGDNSTYLLTSHSKNGYTTSSNHPCLWSPNRNMCSMVCCNRFKDFMEA